MRLYVLYGANRLHAALHVVCMLPCTWSRTTVWSFGIVLVEVFQIGAIPYKSLTNEEVIRAVVRGQRMNCPDGIIHLRRRNSCKGLGLSYEFSVFVQKMQKHILE